MADWRKRWKPGITPYFLTATGVHGPDLSTGGKPVGSASAKLNDSQEHPTYRHVIAIDLGNGMIFIRTTKRGRRPAGPAGASLGLRRQQPGLFRPLFSKATLAGDSIVLIHEYYRERPDQQRW